jgi:UDP-N-acetylglucosamine--N-acetylmuramyl-(pentapeptide) pyrophosphoryl-undecaprenol N-acetylglucosamine transferase
LAAIFIPFPFAADNHQVLNAKELEDAGAAEVILENELTAKRLADRIGYYANSPKEHRRMAEAAKKRGNPMATKTIVDDCYKLLGVEP